MYDRFLSMLNNDECMILLSITLFVIYFMNKQNLEQNECVTKMILLTLLVISSSVSKELTILLCLSYILMTYKKRKTNLENFSILRDKLDENNNQLMNNEGQVAKELVLNTNEAWNKSGIESHINPENLENPPENNFIKELERFNFKGRQAKNVGTASEVPAIMGWKDTICIADDPVILGESNNNNRCNNIPSTNEGPVIGENELAGISKCSRIFGTANSRGEIKEVNAEGRFVYQEEAFAPCAAAFGKTFTRKCKFMTEETVNGVKKKKCYKFNPSQMTGEANPGKFYTGNEEEMDRLLKTGTYPSIIEFIPIKKYKSGIDGNGNDIEMNTNEEFTHHNLQNIKYDYLTTPSGSTGARIDSTIPYTGGQITAAGDYLNNGYYYYKANPNTNNPGDIDTWLLSNPITEDKHDGMSTVPKHKLNAGFRYSYRYDYNVDNDEAIKDGNATKPEGSMIEFESDFDYRRISVFVTSDDTTFTDFFLDYLGTNFVDNVTQKMNDVPIGEAPFFDFNDGVAQLEETFHPNIKGLNYLQMIEEIRDDVYLTYKPYETEFEPGTKEHLNYTINYSKNKLEWEDKTTKNIMRSIGCNRLRDPKTQSYGWWGKDTNPDGTDISRCMYQNKN